MFPAYGRKNNKDDDINHKTRLAVQTAAVHKDRRQVVNVERKQEKKTFQQSGYGETSSEDEGATVPISAVDNELKFDGDPFESAVVKNQKAMKQKLAEDQEKLRGHNPFYTFPSASSSSRRSRSRSRERRRDRSRSRHDSYDRRESSRDDRRKRDRSREKLRKKKEKRRRRSSSSSSSDRSYRRKRSPVKKSVTSSKSIKYKFLALDESLAVNALTTQIFFQQRKYDPENWTLMVPKDEIARCSLQTRFILGLEHCPSLFQKIYTNELTVQKNKPFHERLIEVRNHVPTETFFRSSHPIDGYWKLVANKDIVNALTSEYIDDENEHRNTQTDEKQAELDRWHRQMIQNVHDIEALIKTIELEVEDAKSRQGNFVLSDPRALAERHLAMIEKSIKRNPVSVELQIMKIDQMKKIETDGSIILSSYHELTNKFPQKPMAWISFLDYMQYERPGLFFADIQKAFHKCLEKCEGLLTHTFMSHKIDDIPQLRMFHLSVYIRYIKWLIACGSVPWALANIQATFELNFGLDDETKNRSADDQRVSLSHFWSTFLPRIGDDGGMGMKNMKTMLKLPAAEIEKKEIALFDRLLADTERAIASCLKRQRNLAVNWVEFEREMLEIDARPKRNDLEKCHLYTQELKEDLDIIQTWAEVRYDEVTPFLAPDRESCDFVQPLLEVLGVKFRNSTGCFSMTEGVISEWIPCSNVSKQPIFDSVPSYSEKTSLEIGKNILDYLINQTSKTKIEPGKVDENVLKYILAQIETKASEIVNDPKTIFHQLRWTKCNELIIVMKNYAEVCKMYPEMPKYISLVVFEKIIGWWERAYQDQIFIENHKNIYDHSEFTIISGDKKAIQTIRDKLWIFLNKLFPRGLSGESHNMKNENNSLETLQCQLYANILRSRLYILNEEAHVEVRKALAMEILEKNEDHIDNLEMKGTLLVVVQQKMSDLVNFVIKKENADKNGNVGEFPRASGLAKTLQCALNFVYLNDINRKRETMNTMIGDALKLCDDYEELVNDWKRGIDEKNQARVDLQFHLDVLIAFFAHGKLTITYNECYKMLIKKASELFQCESKYMRKFAELYSGGQLKAMTLRGILDDRNKKLQQKQRLQFDFDIERKILMNSLAIMDSQMKVCRRVGAHTAKSLYKTYQREAIMLRDPAIWRLALKQAARVDLKCLQEDAFVRVQAQCNWSLNGMLDYVEGKSALSNESGKEIVVSALRLLADLNDFHCVYVADVDYLQTQADICGLKPKVEEE